MIFVKKASIEEIKEVAQKLYNYLQPYCKAIYLCGSYAKDYLIHKHDVDLLCLCEDYEDIYNMIKSYQRFLKENDYPDDYKYDVHFNSLYLEKNTIVFQKFNNHFLKPLLGKDYNIDYNILKEKDSYLPLFKEDFAKLSERPPLNLKIYYRFLEVYYVFKNNSYNFTEEQIKNINCLHDSREGSLELRNKLINKLMLEIPELN